MFSPRAWEVASRVSEHVYKLGLVAKACNPTTQEGHLGYTVSSRPVWDMQDPVPANQKMSTYSLIT